jgi:hypothetical protein
MKEQKNQTHTHIAGATGKGCEQHGDVLLMEPERQAEGGLTADVLEVGVGAVAQQAGDAGQHLLPQLALCSRKMDRVHQERSPRGVGEIDSGAAGNQSFHQGFAVLFLQDGHQAGHEVERSAYDCCFYIRVCHAVTLRS